ncbi:MAG: hypothetical protein ACXVYM_05510, partial [Gaiellaceae bacterium]
VAVPEELVVSVAVVVVAAVSVDDVVAVAVVLASCVPAKPALARKPHDTTTAVAAPQRMVLRSMLGFYLVERSE